MFEEEKLEMHEMHEMHKMHEPALDWDRRGQGNASLGHVIFSWCRCPKWLSTRTKMMP